MNTDACTMKTRRSITISELYAGSMGMECDVHGCKNRTFTIYLKPDERLPVEFGYKAALASLKMGEALCKEHAPKEK